MSLLMTIKTLDLGDIFHFLFNGIGINICCGKVVSITFLALLATKTSLLVILVFFAPLALVNRRLLVFATRYVNERNVNKLSSFENSLFIFCRLILLEIPEIDFPGSCGWL